MKPEEIIAEVVAYYLRSGDFNGLPAHKLYRKLEVAPEEGVAALSPLIASGAIAANFGERHPNPHIRAFPDLPAAEQLKLLGEAEQRDCVLYPTPATLAERVVHGDYAGCPYTLRLALGEPQLAYVCFELNVLEYYRRDPRYRVWTNDVTATLSVGDDAFLSEQFPEKHKVLIQHFGFAYSPDFKRSVAVLLCDLSGLSPEHQQIWAAHEERGDLKLHPDFYDSIMGNWGTKSALSDAFLEEQRVINKICVAAGWPHLFRQEFDEPPLGFSFLLRPTVADFNDFALLLDKLISDNIDPKFFPQEISREVEEPREDGKIVIRTRGKIAMLEDWLQSVFRTPDPEPLREMIATFKKIRKLRQVPAHAVKANNHDESLFEQQRLLFLEAYKAIRLLRLVLQNRREAAPIVEAMDQQVRKGQIWSH